MAKSIMKKIINKPVIYISHPIRGMSGDVEGNCKKAIKCVEKLSVLFPDIYFYCPAVHDWTLQELWYAGGLSEDDILWADCEIVKQSDGWVFLCWEPSSGAERERATAIKCGLVYGKENDIKYDISKANFSVLRKTFTSIVDDALSRFRSG